MDARITIIAMLMLGGVFGGRASAQQPDSVQIQQPSPPVLQAIGGSIVGSAAGMVAGVALSGASDACGRFADSSRDRSVGCDTGRWFGLALGGSVLGAATGAWVGAKLGGGSPSAVRTALGAVGGVAGAMLMAWAVDGLGASANPTILSWHVGQGTVTGLAAALW